MNNSKKQETSTTWAKWNIVCYSDNEDAFRFITYILAKKLKFSEQEAIEMGEQFRQNHSLVMGEYIKEIAMSYKHIFDTIAMQQEIDIRIQIEPQE